MSEKRRDNKGRILKTGESQRKDLTYQYRYTDTRGTRKTVYAPSLSELRKKEATIQKELEYVSQNDGSDITMCELFEMYIKLKPNIRPSTRCIYNTILKSLKDDPFAVKQIRDIKAVHAKRWILELIDKGLAPATVRTRISVIKAAFEMACTDEYISKNPFSFRLDFIPSANTRDTALSSEEQHAFLEYIKNSVYFSRRYHMCVFLLETGLRAGELCGLTMKDVDLDNRFITIDHQLLKPTGKESHISDPKSKSGVRRIPLTQRAHSSLVKTIEERPAAANKATVDGYSDFVFVTSTGIPYCTTAIGQIFRRMHEHMKKDPSTSFLPKITPHTLRHTFCTNMISAGLHPKHVQYLMGHNNISITLNRYTHIDSTPVMHEMHKLSLLD